MKKSLSIIAVFIGCLVAMTGCRKDDVANMITLTTEDFTSNGAKTSVSGNEVHWVDGDQIRINDQTGTVSVSGTTASASLSGEISGDIRGYYPASIITASGAANGNTDSPTIIFPKRFASSFSGGRQIIGLPMVGRAAADANTIKMNHVSAAINVRIKNSTGQAKLYLDSVVVVSADKQLCGAASLTLSAGGVPTVAGASNVEANRSVVVYFDEPVLISGDYLQVQVPILPVAAGDLTFKVYTHALMSDIYPGVAKAHYSYNYSRELTNGALGRNVLGTVQIAVTGASTYVTEINRGLFTVNGSNKKVRFSQGNLQYQASTNTWQFAANQYDYIGNAAGNNVFGDSRSSQSAWIDLFGWGTSGWDNGNTNYMPYCNYYTETTSAYGYGPRTSPSSYNYDLTGDYAQADWGVHNSISNGGGAAGIWRTFKSTEWTYVRNTRSADTRFAKAAVNGINGLILFPDEYTHPNGVPSPSYINETGGGGWTGNIYSSSDWKKMEAMGAIFLPITGRAENATIVITGAGIGYYWSTTQSNTKALNFYFGSSVLGDNTIYRYYGCAVRVVRDM